MKINIAEMKKSASKAAELLKVLANPTRLMIVCHLAEGEASVSEITDFIGIRGSTVSQHLQVLRLSGMVETRREAQTIYYSLAHDASEDIIRALHKNYCIFPTKKSASKKPVSKKK